MGGWWWMGLDSIGCLILDNNYYGFALQKLYQGINKLHFHEEGLSLLGFVSRQCNTIRMEQSHPSLAISPTFPSTPSQFPLNSTTSHHHCQGGCIAVPIVLIIDGLYRSLIDYTCRLMSCACCQQGMCHFWAVHIHFPGISMVGVCSTLAVSSRHGIPNPLTLLDSLSTQLHPIIIKVVTLLSLSSLLLMGCKCC